MGEAVKKSERPSIGGYGQRLQDLNTSKKKTPQQPSPLPDLWEKR
jgi:hypothetical protein